MVLTASRLILFMFWNRKKEDKLLHNHNAQSGAYGQRIRTQFWRQRSSRWSVYMLGILVFIGVFADFIANEKPIYCQYQGETYWPIVKTYVVDLGLGSWDEKVKYLDWHDANYDKVILPPIPYSATYQDRDNTGFKKPYGPQNLKSGRYRHWLGTDQLGRDIAAGMVRGTRISLAVGLLSMFVASVIGIVLGMIGGYYGDKDARTSRGRLVIYLLGVFYILFLMLVSSNHIALGSLTLAIIITVGVTYGLLKVSDRIDISGLQKQVSIPWDIMIMRLIEVINSFPGLFTMLAIVAVVNKPSIILLMMIIGLIRWTGIARFARAEMLKVRSSGYIQAAKGLGLSDWRILYKQALPNVLPPILITIAFGIAGAILLESFLSFLGIGVDASEVTWGSLLQTARQNIGNWWLALFPGLAIFITVTVFNLIGDGLTKAMID